eukprot:9241688-Alexandrium_andersonii.AAC.1
MSSHHADLHHLWSAAAHRRLFPYFSGVASRRAVSMLWHMVSVFEPRCSVCHARLCCGLAIAALRAGCGHARLRGDRQLELNVAAAARALQAGARPRRDV